MLLNVTVLLGSSSFKWAQTHLCRPSGYGYGDYWLFVQYSQVLRYRALQPSSVRREGYTNYNLPVWDLEWYWTRVPDLFLLHITSQKRRRNIIGQLSKKNKQYITPPPTLARVCTALLQFNYRHLCLSTQIV